MADLLRGMLRMDPIKRLSCFEVAKQWPNLYKTTGKTVYVNEVKPVESFAVKPKVEKVEIAPITPVMTRMTKTGHRGKKLERPEDYV